MPFCVGPIGGRREPPKNNRRAESEHGSPRRPWEGGQSPRGSDAAVITVGLHKGADYGAHYRGGSSSLPGTRCWVIIRLIEAARASAGFFRGGRWGGVGDEKTRGMKIVLGLSDCYVFLRTCLQIRQDQLLAG